MPLWRPPSAGKDGEFIRGLEPPGDFIKWRVTALDIRTCIRLCCRLHLIQTSASSLSSRTLISADSPMRFGP